MAVISFVAGLRAATCIRSRTGFLSERWLETGFFRHQPKWSRAISQRSGSTEDAGRTPLKADAYARFQGYQARENFVALKKVNFKHAPSADQQHLDVGCGPGGFTKSNVLQHCSPCSRLVAVDKSPAMIDVAQKTSQHPRIYHDVLDIEAGEMGSFVKKYGRFSRIYSFLCFHFLKSQRAGYLNVGNLLADDGECFVTACLQTSFVNAWIEVRTSEKWKHFIPDPMEVFPNMHYSDSNISLRNLKSQVRNVVACAGLRCLDCDVYKSDMEFPDAETAADMIIGIFDFEANVPLEDRSELRNAWRDALLKMRTKTCAGFALSSTFYAVRATL